MWLRKVARSGERGIKGLAKIFNSVGAALIVVLMSLTVGEVIGRYVFNRPIKGSYEMIEYFMGVAVTFTMAYVMVKSRHIRIELLLNLFSQRYRAALEALAYFFGMATFGIVTWQMFLFEEEMRLKAEGTPILMVPVAPFVLVVTIAWGIFSLTCLVKLVRSIAGGRNN